MTPLFRRIRTFADVSFGALFVAVADLFIASPFYAAKAFGVFIIIFVFLLLAQERADYRRGD
jgi:hypothetical protein